MNESAPKTKNHQGDIDSNSVHLFYLQQQELDRLATLLRNATSGAWAIALYNTVVIRDQVMDALRNRLQPIPLYDFTFTENLTNPLAYLKQLPPETKDQRTIIFLYDITRSGERVWGYLEMQREALADHPHGLVFWMTPAEHGEAVRKAPNFWSQRSGVFDFTIADDRALMQMRRAGSEQSARFTDKADWERKVRLYQGLLEEYKQCNDVPADTQMDLYHKLFTLQYTVGNYQKAQDLVQEQLVLARNTENEEQTAQGLYNLGLVYTDLVEWDRAIDIYQQSLQTYERLGDVRGKAQTINTLGSVYAQKGEWDRATEYFKKALEISERLGDEHGRAQTWGNLGEVYRMKGQWDRAIEYYEKALEISERLGDELGRATTLMNLGTVYLQKGEWDRASEYYEQALETFERLGDEHGMAQTWNNLGNVYADQAAWDRASEYYEKALEISERLGDVHGMAQTWNNLGMVYADQGAWGRAIAMYEQSLATKERLGDVRGMAQTWGNLGLVCADKGEWDRAIEMYQKSLAITEKMGDWLTSANQYTNLGILYLQTDRLDAAKPLLARAYLICAQLGSPHEQAAVNALVHAFDGDVDAANVYLAQVAEEMQANDESSKT